jgi:pSer/pThr/pTyr-binding forkhead associated (FHA) protein
MAALTVKDGASAGQRFELDGDKTIGREGADIVIDDSQMSRRHARLGMRDGALEIEDLGSTNGTFVNGAKIGGVTQLSPGDTIRVGMTTLQLEGAASAATVAAPAVTMPSAPAPAPAAAPAAAAMSAPPAPSGPSGGTPIEPFGTYLAPASQNRRGGIASRQLGPMLATYAVVLATAVAIAIYFGLN